MIGDQAQVRERARIGAESVIGRGSAVDNDVTVGERVKVQSNCYVTAGTVVEDDVFIGPGVVLTNDNTMGRHPRGDAPTRPILRRACRIGGGAVVCPGSRSARRRSSGPARSCTDDVSGPQPWWWESRLGSCARSATTTCSSAGAEPRRTSWIPPLSEHSGTFGGWLRAADCGDHIGRRALREG